MKQLRKRLVHEESAAGDVADRAANNEEHDEQGDQEVKI
jgi:hypothetical protein